MKERTTEQGEILNNDLVSYVKISVEFYLNNPNDEMFPLLVNLVNGLNATESTKLSGATQVEKETQKEVETFCSVHNKQMKERTNQKGGKWFDHRQETNGQWELCYGKGYPSEKN